MGEARASERRIVLDDDARVVTLTTDDLPRRGALRTTLRWQRLVTSTGLLRASDVHLGCLWQTTNGYSGAVMSDGALSAPGFGARQVLSLGMRSEDDGELLLADLANLDLMQRLLFFAYGKHADPDWTALRPELVVRLPTGGRLELRVGAPDVPGARCLAVASAHLVDGDVILRREHEFVAGPPREVALAYGWDLAWTDGGTVVR
ncbi:hypothetical protein GCM10028814_34790 [Angustibacter aerolatus]